MIFIRCKAGDRVKVRPLEQILATLDDKGCTHGMPFMPEMAKYCGQTYPVFKNAHKTCDSTHFKHGRYMEDTVMLDLRCDGAAHDACEASCLLFFRLEWLEPVEPSRPWGLPAAATASAVGRDIDWLRSTTVSRGADGQPVYRCQGTDHLNASVSFKPNEFRMFVADVRSGNATVGETARAFLLQYLYKLRDLPFGWRVWTGLYDKVHRLFFGKRNPFYECRIPNGQPTPDVRIGLKAGEWVRVRPSRNRGLSYNPEMSTFCGEVRQVRHVVRRIIDEKTGRMLDMKGPCIILEGGYCLSRYHPEAVQCPRRIPQYFREAWLERVEAPAASTRGAG
jgi:hypothetical protein